MTAISWYSEPRLESTQSALWTVWV